MLDHVRTWTYDTHIAQKYVDELWQFVDVSLAHDVTPLGFAWIILCSLYLIGIGIYTHGTELETGELIAIDTISLLPEENRTWHRDLSDDSDDGCYPPEACNKEREGYKDIEQTLCDAVEWIEQRLTTQSEDWNIINIFNLHSSMNIVANVRNRIESDEVILAIVHNLQYFLGT